MLLLRLLYHVAPLAHIVCAASDVVTLSNVEYIGVALPNGISQWLGIPYAAPPVGDLRFAPPVDPSIQPGTYAADTVSCPNVLDNTTTKPLSKDLYASQPELEPYLAVNRKTACTWLSMLLHQPH